MDSPRLIQTGVRVLMAGYRKRNPDDPNRHQRRGLIRRAETVARILRTYPTPIPGAVGVIDRRQEQS